MKTVLNVLLFIIGGLALALIVAAKNSPHPAPVTVVEASAPDPARDHRLRAAKQMLARASELNERVRTQCSKAAPPECAVYAQAFIYSIAADMDEAVKDEAKFMKLVDRVQAWERKVTPALQRLESH